MTNSDSAFDFGPVASVFVVMTSPDSLTSFNSLPCNPLTSTDFEFVVSRFAFVHEHFTPVVSSGAFTHSTLLNRLDLPFSNPHFVIAGTNVKI